MNNNLPQQGCESDRVFSLLHRFAGRLARHTALFGIDDEDGDLFAEYAIECNLRGESVCQDLRASIEKNLEADRLIDEAKVFLHLKIECEKGSPDTDLESIICLNSEWSILKAEECVLSKKKKISIPFRSKCRNRIVTDIVAGATIEVFNRDLFGGESIAAYIIQNFPMRKDIVIEVVACDAIFDGVTYRSNISVEDISR